MVPKPMNKWMILGVPLFLETPTWLGGGGLHGKAWNPSDLFVWWLTGLTGTILWVKSSKIWVSFGF